MKIDNSKPWKESINKAPKLGTVLEAIIENDNDNIKHREDIKKHLDEVDKDIQSKLNDLEESVKKETLTHTSAKGPKHGETKATIGLDKKENLPAANIEDINNKVYKRAFLTPATLNKLLDNDMSIDNSRYMEKGSSFVDSLFPLGRTLSNQQFLNDTTPLPERNAFGPVSYMLSTEEDYLIFSELGEGPNTNFSEGGEKAPLGTSHIAIRSDKITLRRGYPVSLNSVTMTEGFVKNNTGLQFGFSPFGGNFYDSNYYPTQVVEEDTNISSKQSVESTLFDPVIIYKPEGNIGGRCFNSTVHHFNEFVLNKQGTYPFKNASFLSNENTLLHVADCRLEKQTVWGICFDLVSGDIGYPDWLPDTVTRNTEKIFSKRAYYTIKETLITSIDGYEGALGSMKLSEGKPFGVENRENFYNSNFAGAVRYSNVFIPIEAIIKGFNNLPTDKQQLVIDNIDKDLLFRVVLDWKNKFTNEGLIRIPVYYTVPNSTVSWCMWLDLSFKLNFVEDSIRVDMNAINFDTNQRPNIGSDLNLGNENVIGKFRKWGVKDDNPLHPKYFSGCFVETGGHVKTYIIGHRQYTCYYKHEIKSKKDWILNDIYPTITKTDIHHSSTLPSNGFYNESLRYVPVKVDTQNGKITYFGFGRNKYGRYQDFLFETKSDHDLTVDLAKPVDNVIWKKYNPNNTLVPLLVENLNFNQLGLNISGKIFSEKNSFTGYLNVSPNSNTGFNTTGKIKIDNVLFSRLSRTGNIYNPYIIMFLFQNVLYCVNVSRTGKVNDKGFDSYFCAIRVDLVKEDNEYRVRAILNQEVKGFVGKLFEKYDRNLNGLDNVSFDDIFIVPVKYDESRFRVYLNRPDLAGNYYELLIKRDNQGYYYPERLESEPLDMLAMGGYKDFTPHKFYRVTLPPFMAQNSLSVGLYDDNLFGVKQETVNGVVNKRSYYMGWKNELPLLSIGQTIHLIDDTALIDETISYTNESKNGLLAMVRSTKKVKLFTGYVSGFNLYDYILVGFWSNIDNKYCFTYHAPRGVSGLESFDFTNSQLPAINNGLLSIQSNMDTKPVMLGKRSGVPRQYYFKK